MTISADSFSAKVALGLRLRFALAKVAYRRRVQVTGFRRNAQSAEETCPICESRAALRVAFDRPEGRIKKFLCLRCEHLYSRFLQTEPLTAGELFQFGTENDGKLTQVELIEETVLRSGRSSGTFLDFGAGGNISAFQEAARRAPAHSFMACDVYTSDVPGYFRTYHAREPEGTFDGISSYAVVEHLTETLDTWRSFNRLLKPMSEGGGIMVHAFPSQLHHDFDHWAIQIHTHACVFSRRSLRIACGKTGFALTRADPPRPVGPHQHPVLVFRKTRDL